MSDESAKEAGADKDSAEAGLNPKERGLGRGLDALFGDEEAGSKEDEGLGSAEATSTFLNLDQLEPNQSQPRQDFNEKPLGELAESIVTHGILQPILVRPKEGYPGKYQIIAGERRWRAAQMARLHEVPVIVKNTDDSETLQVALIENLQREDLNPLEEASSYRNLIERFGFNQERLAAVLGKSRSNVANTIRLLSLPDSVQTYLWEGKITAGHARAILSAKNQEELAREIVDKGLSVREAEKLANESVGRKPKASSGETRGAAPKDPDILALEEELSNSLGMKVFISSKGEAGSVKIIFKNLDQFDDLLHRLSSSSADVVIEDTMLDASRYPDEITIEDEMPIGDIISATEIDD
jgi:ParB family chromosome partitioning protein